MPIFDKGIRAILSGSLNPFGISVRNYAARKGTRAKRAKSKVKVEVQKVGFIPHNQRNLEKFLASRPKLKFDDSWKQLPTDNVYPHKYYQWTVYPFIEAIKCLKENNHPDMFNLPNAEVFVNVELNMTGEKKGKFLDNFQRIVKVPITFEHGEDRTVIAFTKDEKKQKEAQAAGATMVGGVELIKEIQNGAIMLTDFQFVIADPAILAELVILRGVMRKRFPNVKAGTLDENIVGVVSKLVDGVKYEAKKDEYEKDYGLVRTIIGNLTMDAKQLENNFSALIQDIQTMKPKVEAPFIVRVLLSSPPCREQLKVDHKLYIKEKAQKEAVIEDEDVPKAVAQ